MIYLIIFLLATVPAECLTAELKYKLQGSECSDGKSIGINLGHYGACGQFNRISPAERLERNKDLRGSRVRYFSFQRFNGRNFKLDYSRWVMASIFNSNFSQAEFRDAELTGILLQGTLAKSASFTNAHMNGARIYFSDLREASFQGAQLRFAVFVESNFSGADFRGANLQGAQIQLSRLEGARYNSSTILPFSEAEAKIRGMRRTEE